jgi:DNA-binding transcriptional regulator YiaG
MPRRGPSPEGSELPRRLALPVGQLERWLLAAPDFTPARLQALRRRLGLTRRQLARWLGLSESAVSLWEAGRRRPRGPAHRLLGLVDELTREA